MAGIFQGDIIIKTAIDLGIEDMKKNPWLLNHMLSDLVKIGYFRDKYGEKQIESCKEWFRNAQIDVYMRARDDKDRLPCVTVQMGPSNEKPEMKTMADQSTERAVLMPNQIGKPIPYMVKPFTPMGYDEDTGIVSVPSTVDLSLVTPDMILVNPATGQGYLIQDTVDEGILIESNLNIQASQFGVVPQYQYYIAMIEHSFFDESYIIGCHAHGDPQNVLFLWSIVKYSILRYRESLLEANGFCESTVSSSGPDFDEAFTTQGGEKAWARFMTLQGQTENTWIKSPRRIIEVANLRKKTSAGYIGGISIISNTDPSIIDKTENTWYTDTEQELEEAAGTFVPPAPPPSPQSFILLETGDLFLLENGVSFILTEKSA
jgi:hypothetical protein